MITDITYHRNYNKEWSNIETIAKYTYDDADDTASEGSK